MKDYKYYDELESMLNKYNEDLTLYDLAKGDELAITSLIPYVADQVQDEEEAEDVLMLFNKALQTLFKIPFKTMGKKYKFIEYVKTERIFNVMFKNMDDLCIMFPSCYVHFFELMADYIYMAFENDLYYFGTQIYCEFVEFCYDKFEYNKIIPLNCSKKSAISIFNKCFDILENACMYAIEQMPRVEREHNEEEARRHERFGWFSKYDDLVLDYYVESTTYCLEAICNYCGDIIDIGLYKRGNSSDIKFKAFVEKKIEKLTSEGYDVE